MQKDEQLKLMSKTANEFIENNAVRFDKSEQKFIAKNNSNTFIFYVDEHTKAKKINGCVLTNEGEKITKRTNVDFSQLWINWLYK